MIFKNSKFVSFKKASRRNFIKTISMGTAAMVMPRITSGAPKPKGDNPNIIFILVDDMGYGDARCYNPQSRIPTPNIDRLAKEGMRFTDAHAPAGLCVPSRYGLLTGRYPFRARRSLQIKPGQMTLGSLLQKKGYHTGMVGKWHLGFEGGTRKRDFSQPMHGGPVDSGFDYFFGIPASLDIPPYYYIENDRCMAAPTDRIKESHSKGVKPIQGAFWRAGGIAPGFKHEEVVSIFNEKAVSFIENHHKEKDNQPFFLYFAQPGPHTPWLPTERFHGKSQAGDYGDYTARIDDSVGQILRTLDRLKLTDNTLVFFTSDNGPVWYKEDITRYGHRSSGNLRGMKGDAWEGGHRMPFIACWPKKIPAGTISREVICFTDMIATFAAITREKLPPDAGVDSYNILPVLLGKKITKPIREATVTLSAGGLLAIRQGSWKLIDGLGSGGFSKPRYSKKYKPKPGEPAGQLYNLENDLSETRNLYLEHPERAERLIKLLEKYKEDGRSTPVIKN